MDTAKLRSWLGLPPGPWPPDDRTLLGLEAGPVTAAEAERKALALMAKLRPHQLVHPELVTEGMNRLAQALLAVSMGASSAPSQVKPAPVVQPAEQQVAVAAAQSAPIVEAKPAVAPAAPIALTLEPGPVALVPAEPGPGLSEPVVGPLPTDRRAAYRQLAGLRAVLRSWDRLRPFFADPSESVPTAGHVLDFLEATREFRSALAHQGLARNMVAEFAPRTVAVASQPLALAVFRSLTPSQRLSLAKDWATSRAGFEAYTKALRTAVRRSAAGRKRPAFRRALRGLGANPEWMLAVAAGVVFVLAGMRMILR
jgi:hypothetical protein